MRMIHHPICCELNALERYYNPLVNRAAPLQVLCAMKDRKCLAKRQAEEQQQGMVKSNEKQLHVAMDVSHFKPDEISVRVLDTNVVEIEGKHEEKKDEQGFVCRHFVRKFKLPDNVDAENVSSSLSDNGTLTIQIPKREKKEEKKVRKVSIQRISKKSEEVAEKSKL